MSLEVSRLNDNGWCQGGGGDTEYSFRERKPVRHGILILWIPFSYSHPTLPGALIHCPSLLENP